jgi:hypothetical protein
VGQDALLFWEGLVRARPAESSPQDDPEIQQLIAAGLIEEVELEPLGRQALPEIGRRLEDLLRARGGRLPAGIPGIRGLRGTSSKWEERVRAELLESLRSFPLAEKAFAEAPNQAGALFFIFWAEKIARERYFAPVTDDPTFAAITEYFKYEQVTEETPRVTSVDWHAIAVVCLPSPKLDAIAHLSVEQLLDIRRKYAAQRRHFRRTVQARVSEIAQLPTVQAVEEHLRSLREEIREDLQAASEAMKDTKVKERWSLLAVGTPMSVGLALAIAGGTSPVVGSIEGIGAMGLGVTGWFTQKRMASASRERPYLLSLDGALKEPWQGLRRALDNLVRG